MKKIGMLMLGLLAGTVSFAHQPLTSTTPARLVMNTENKIRLYVQPLQSKGQLAIWDANGRPVYFSTVALQKGLSRQFDFSSLSAGTYRLTLQTNAETVTKRFVVQANPNESFVVQEP
ncbi:T9SS type A sorting domain-containing protein [Larkinella terrae]|uniref:T9SS type A sorting domain-containing protein n=1 Tax=Larkinella terrae TaxID=2025311 RepID=A0A7K0EVB2_9BACT|nr:T9SS type A sorting domain-containing protein [Larkinella terrae]MRS65368.1 T9SS type A sorting domain-containing protein [Larkinella terrae]